MPEGSIYITTLSLRPPVYGVTFVPYKGTMTRLWWRECSSLEEFAGSSRTAAWCWTRSRPRFGAPTRGTRPASERSCSTKLRWNGWVFALPSSRARRNGTFELAGSRMTQCSYAKACARPGAQLEGRGHTTRSHDRPPFGGVDWRPRRFLWTPSSSLSSFRSGAHQKPSTDWVMMAGCAGA